MTAARNTGATVSRPAASARPSNGSGGAPAPRPAASPRSDAPGLSAGNHDKPEPKILFQTYFKSVGPRTYASQLKEAGNGNHFLVLTEGKRDEASGEIRKHRIYVFSEDLPAFFRMLHETAQFIKAHPVPEEVKKRRQKYWERKAADERRGSLPAATVTQPRPQPAPTRARPTKR